jgi:hypothetical protein
MFLAGGFAACVKINAGGPLYTLCTHNLVHPCRDSDASVPLLHREFISSLHIVIKTSCFMERNIRDADSFWRSFGFWLL